MCYNCGCGIPNDDMGDPNNVTNDTFDKLAEKWGVDNTTAKQDVLEMIKGEKDQNSDVTEMFKKASSAWGQSVEDAEKETEKLLEKVLKKNGGYQ